MAVRLLSISEVADSLAVSQRTVKRLINGGHLVGVRLAGVGRVRPPMRVTVQSVNDYLARCGVPVDKPTRRRPSAAEARRIEVEMARLGLA